MIEPGLPEERLRGGRPRAIGSGASLATLVQVTAAIAGGLSTLVVARATDASGTGAYSVVLATLAALTTITALGLDVSALHHVAGKRWSAADAIRQLQLAALALGGLGLSLGVVAWFLLRSTAFHGVPLSTLALGLAAVPFALSWTFTSAVAFAREQYERAALPGVVQGISGLALVSMLSPFFGVLGAVAALTTSHALTAATAWLGSSIPVRARAQSWLRAARSDLRRAVRFGYRANLTNAMALINQRADVLILNAYAAHAVVGQYSVALSLTAMQLLVPSSLSRVLVPRVSKLDSDSATLDLARTTSKSLKHAVLASAIVAVAMIGALLAVPMVFGASFQPSVRLGWILVPGTAAYGASYAFSAIIVGHGRPEYVLRVAAAVTPFTLVLYFALISQFSATGAAVASTLSYSTTFFLCWRYLRRVTHISSLRILVPGRAELQDYRHVAKVMRSTLARPLGQT